MPRFGNPLTVTTKVIGGHAARAWIAAHSHRRSGEVHVGIVDADTCPGRPGRTPAHVAMVHEYGAPEENIAESAFYRSTNLDLIEDGTAAKHLLDQSPAALGRLGAEAAQRYREAILRAGLKDTGLLLGSQGYQVQGDGDG